MKKPETRKYYLIPLLSILLANLSGCSMLKPRENIVFTCTPTQLFRCEPDAKSCMTIPVIKTLGAVQITLDLAIAKVTSSSNGKQLSTADINSVQIDKQLVYLQGKGIGYDKAYRSWNAIINRENGKLYSASITTGVGHVIYGECHEHTQ